MLQKTSRVLQGAAGSPSVPLPFLPKLSRCPERSLGQDWGSPPGTHLLITAQSLLLPPPSIFLSSAGGKEPLRLWGPCACPLLTLHWEALGECQGCEGCQAFWAEQTEDPLGSHAFCGGPKFTSLLSCELGREDQDTHSLPHPTGTPLQSVFSYGQCIIYLAFPLQGSFSMFPLQNIPEISSRFPLLPPFWPQVSRDFTATVVFLGFLGRREKLSCSEALFAPPVQKLTKGRCC